MITTKIKNLIASKEESVIVDAIMLLAEEIEETQNLLNKVIKKQNE